VFTEYHGIQNINLKQNYSFQNNELKTSSRTMAQGSTKSLTEMSTRNLPDGTGRPTRKADHLTIICKPNVLKTWEPRCLTTLWASTACYTDSTRQRSALKRYATSRKVAGSNSDEVIGFFNLPNPSSHTMALWLIQPLTEMTHKAQSQAPPPHIHTQECARTRTHAHTHTHCVYQITVSLIGSLSNC
jgi:hypothetical protein